MDGTAKVYVYPDIRAPEERRFLGKAINSSTPFERIYLSTVAPAVSIALEGTGAFQLDSFAIRLEKLAV